MAPASSATVLGDFAAAGLEGVRPVREGDGFTMEVAGQRRQVDLVLASGRQHQVYVTRTVDGVYTPLPLIWSTWTKEWLPTSLYQQGDLDLTQGCFSCHLSQAHRKTGAAPATAWVDLAINCESCHGPGRAHVQARRAGKPDVYRDLHALSKVEESRVCGQCHGFQLKPYVFARPVNALPEIFVTSLVNQSLRPDGTQSGTSYQYPGHVLSECFQQGTLTCNSCHQPHSLRARNFAGVSAEGAATNQQCTICHTTRRAPAGLTQHSHHRADITCVNCHMAFSWIGDDDKRKQRTSDHSISIPRPQESLTLGTPNACTTCHQDRDASWALGALTKWGATRALGVRRWVETIALARKRDPDATARLLELVAADKTPRYLLLSALDLLVIQPPDPRVPPALQALTQHSAPELRAAALRALASHDPAGRQRWLDAGLGDAHPFVRMEAFSQIKDPATLTPAAFERQLADVLAHQNPPVQGLQHLVTLRHKRGELGEALALIDLLGRIVVPHERQQLHLDDVRARLQQSADKR